MADHEKLRILVIDDEITQRMLVKDFLEEAGHIVRQAEDGRRGLKMAEVTRPDVILLDVLLPVLDGYSVCKKFKEAPETADTPVILITASRETHVIEKGLAAGADDFLTKPVDWAFLSDRVVNVVKKARERAEMARQLKQRSNGDDREHGAAGIQFPADPRLDEYMRNAEAQIAQANDAAARERHKLEGEYAEALTGALQETREAKDAEIALIRKQHDLDVKALKERHERDAEAIRVSARVDLRKAESRLSSDLEAARYALEIAKTGFADQSQSFRMAIAAEHTARTSAAWDFALRWATAQSTMAATMTADLQSALGNPASADLQSLDRSAKAIAAAAAKFKIVAQAMATPAGTDTKAAPIADLVREIAGQAESVSRARRINVSCAIVAGDIALCIDVERLRYAMLSLVSNAIRFTPAGGSVELAVSRRDTGDIEISVIDSGVGIPPAKLRDLQFCLDEPRREMSGDNSANIGLGIPAAMALARHMGGMLELESQIGAGTRASLIFGEKADFSLESARSMKIAG